MVVLIDLSKVIKKIKPSESELKEEKKIVKELTEKIRLIEGKHLDIVLAGSISRETHLKGDRDIDLFILFDKALSREEFEKEGLRIAKTVFRGFKWEKAFSEHPYIRGEIKGFKIEIVPSYKISDTSELQSAVDRTPFHTKYLLQHLREEQKDEVRLLRQFLKGIKCYGADLKTSSFSGYMTELIILKYGSFLNALKAASEWSKGEVIDLENFYSAEEARKKFNSHFIVLDPTDKNRNVAGALAFNQFCRLIAASRMFLIKPSEKFFFGLKEKSLNEKKVKQLLEKEDLIGIELGYPKKVISDVVWGQIKRLRKKIESELTLNEFQVIRADDWTDEKKLVVILIEVENELIQQIHKRIGPEITDKKNSEMFLKAHLNPFTGPRIENGRWVVEVKRKYFSSQKLLQDLLKNYKKNSKETIKKSLNKKTRILFKQDIISLYKKNKEFQEYFTKFLKGREEFLEY